MVGNTFLLTGDIGGTNSRMALYHVNDPTALVVKFYRNQDYLTEKKNGIFESTIVSPFLQHCFQHPEKNLLKAGEKLEDIEIIACLAVAGPVRNNAVQMSNLHDIEIDGTAIAAQKFCPKDPYLARIKVCRIINDFVAQGYGCLTLKPHEVRQLNPDCGWRNMDPTGPKVCVGAGTGLGECFLTPDAEGIYTCFPSEGGHVEWAPRDDLESKLWKYLQEKFAYRHRVSVERVVSGRGLANCYEFLAHEFPDKVDKKVDDEFRTAGDEQGRVVAVNATKGSLCEQALEIMLGAYGSEVGSAGVKFIPTGGLFVTGGLTPKNIGFIEGQNTSFMKAYYDKGRVRPILDHVPLFAVMTEDLGVRGAYMSALLEYEKYTSGHPKTSSASTIGDSELKLILAGLAAGAIGLVLGITGSRSWKSK